MTFSIERKITLMLPSAAFCKGRTLGY